MMENPQKNFFLSNWEFFVWNWEKTILFGNGNGAVFRPQNRVIESPAFQTKKIQKHYRVSSGLKST